MPIFLETLSFLSFSFSFPYISERLKTKKNIIKKLYTIKIYHYLQEIINYKNLSLQNWASSNYLVVDGFCPWTIQCQYQCVPLHNHKKETSTN